MKNTDKERLIKFVKSAMVIAHDYSWTEGGTDMTRWDVCTGCYRADWQDHSDDCPVSNFFNEANELLDVLNSIEVK